MVRVLRVLAAAAASAGLLVVVPWALIASVGNPADRLPDLLAGDVNTQVVLAGFAAVLWLAWAQFAVAFAVELVSAIRRTPMPRRIPGVFAFQQGLARSLVNAALLVLPLAVSSVAPAGQGIAMASAAPPATAAATAGGQVSTAAMAVKPTVPVRPLLVTGDGARTWWDLAGAQVGDPTRWAELWALNQGRTMPDGVVLRTDRVVLQPGWTVLVPADTPAAPGAAVGAAPPGGAETAGADEVTVVVRPGDTLSQIAWERTGSADWTGLWNANGGRAEPGGQRFTDPDYLEPGWTIVAPAVGTADSAGPGADKTSSTAGQTRVIVRPGDTLSGIAADHGADLDAVIAANTGVLQPDGGRLTDPDWIEPGWVLTLPGASADSASADSGAPAEPLTPESSTPTAAAGTTTGPDLAPPPAAPPAAPATPTSPAPTATAPPAAAPATPAAPGSPPAPPAAASAAGTETGTTADQHPDDSGSDIADRSSWSAAMAVFAGGGGVLAALLLAALLRARRRQERHRRPGELVTGAPDELLEMERALLSAGSANAADAQWIDEALRGLGHTVAASGGTLHLPDVLALCVTDEQLRLVLADAPAEPVGSWVQRAERTWILDRGLPTGYDPARRDRDVAPYPALVTVGYTPGGEHWLLDLEHLGAVTLTGDADRAADLARFVAAELAHNSWAEQVQVTLAGFGAEMAQMIPDRLTFAADPAAAVRSVAAQFRSVSTLIDDTGLPVLQGRGGGIAGEAWAPHVLLIAPGTSGDPADPAAVADLRAELADLLAAATDRGDRRAVALVVVAGGPDGTDTGAAAPSRVGWELHVDGEGVLSIPELGVDLVAQQLPAGQAAQLAQLLALAARTDRVTQAPPLAAGSDWSSGGAGPPEQRDRWARAGSALPMPEQVYLEQAATTARDLQTLAPVVDPAARAELAAADADLDRDVAEWTDQHSTRPRIAMLGPVAVFPQGGASTRPLPAMKAETAVYLAVHAAGVSPERYGTDLWPEDPDIAGSTKLRNSVYELRRAFGVNPRTGGEYLPRNAATTGAVYRLDDVLVDADLFRRLRLRGITRPDEAGRLADWWLALGLVRGAPFTHRRPGGYSWLAGQPADHEYTAMLVDLAHAVATHHLAAGEPDRAEHAAKIALLAAGGASDISLLDLVWACDAQDRRAEGDSYVKQILANNDADDLEELPPRTYDVLRRRQWLPPAA